MVLFLVVADDEVVCVDHMPALVCGVCGDVQFDAETVRLIQALLEPYDKPDKHLPTYEINRSASVA